MNFNKRKITMIITENTSEFFYDKPEIRQSDISNHTIRIAPPRNKPIIIYGTSQSQKTNDMPTHKLTLNVKYENGTEISDTTKIRITKESFFGIINLARITYHDLKSKYSFKQNIEFRYGEHLKIYIINPEFNIPKENIKFSIEADELIK